MTRSTLEQLIHYGKDIELAASCDAAILISASPREAFTIARLIAASRREGPPPHMIVCDPAEGDDLPSVLADARLTDMSAGDLRLLLLREVHVLSSADQTALTEWLKEFRYSVQVLASSSVDLYEWVGRCLFDEQLFYRLNQIHIIGLTGGPCGLAAERSRDLHSAAPGTRPC